MKTEIFAINPDNIDYSLIEKAGQAVKNGGLAAFPTETVYGLGGSALDASAAKKIYAAKGRPSDNPLIIHICKKEQLDEYCRDISETARKLINAFMPGPFTVILKKKACIPDEVTAGMDTVAVRFPKNKIACALINAAGVPIAAPSANISGKPSPTEAKHVIHDMNGKIDFIIDGGKCSVGVESTIVDASGEIPVLLRPGGITLDMLKNVVPQIAVDEHVLKSVSADEQPKCPGMKYKHYAPDADVTVVEGEKEQVRAEIRRLLNEHSDMINGVLTMYGSDYDNAVMISAGESNRKYAANLFAALRKFDDLGIENVYAEFCEKDGYGLAVKNRLYKSAGNKVIHV